MWELYASTMTHTRRMDVSTIRFCQDSISDRFAHGVNKNELLPALLKDLRSGAAQTEHMPPLVVITTEKFGCEVVMGHRRLWCYKAFAQENPAEKTFASCYEWVYPTVHGLPSKLKAKWLLTRTKTTDGLSVNLRNSQERSSLVERLDSL